MDIKIWVLYEGMRVFLCCKFEEKREERKLSNLGKLVLFRFRKKKIKIRGKRLWECGAT
jgi:hypothetical protein